MLTLGDPHPLSGGIGCIRAVFFVYPKDRLVVTVLTNAQGLDRNRSLIALLGAICSLTSGGHPRSDKQATTQIPGAALTICTLLQFETKSYTNIFHGCVPSSWVPLHKVAPLIPRSHPPSQNWGMEYSSNKNNRFGFQAIRLKEFELASRLRSFANRNVGLETRSNPGRP